jgi:hypothetical protein
LNNSKASIKQTGSQKDFFPDIVTYDSKMSCYSAYEQLHGDMIDHKQFNFSHGDWIVVGHGKEKTNYKCGAFRRYDACLNIEGHKHSKLNEHSHSSEVFVHMVHYWCYSYSCPVCYFKGACLREAEHGTQRIKFGSIGGKDEKGVYHAPLGEPQHLIVSPCQNDHYIAEFEHQKFFDKVKNICQEVGILNSSWIFHGFRYADYQESLEKGVPYGFYWSPHYHLVGFILGGYGACRHCSKTARVIRTRGGKTVTKHGDKRLCYSCGGFEQRVRESNEKNGYVIVNTDERQSIFGTLLYQLSHMAIKKR